MLTEEEIKEAEGLSEKSEVVKRLLQFYMEAQEDGLKALRISLNKKLIEVSQTVTLANVDDNDDKTFERIDKIVTSLKKLGISDNDIEKVITKRNKEHEGKPII